MTVIILQIMRYGLYSTVDSNLKNAVDSPDKYVTQAMVRRNSIQIRSSDATSNSSFQKIKPSGDTNNVNVILYNENGTILNSLDTFLKFGTDSLSLDQDNIGDISEKTVFSAFGSKDKYHLVTVQVSISDYPMVKYATFLVSVRQLDEANEHYKSITITVMVIFWIISVLASVYLSAWSRKPILESYEKQKSFVENASHELRTPLTVLQNRLESLFRKPDTTILENSESIAASLDEVRNMRILTTNLLNLARRDDGLKPVMEDIQKKTVDEIFENYEIIAEESGKVFKGHNLVTRDIKSDKTLLRQLMTILFDNAIKYTDNDGIIDFTIKTTDKQTIITVADNGPGISDIDKKKIFDRFYRIDKARTRQKGGFGLGLSLAKQIVDSLKGNIVVKDNHPKGTVFEVRL